MMHKAEEFRKGVESVMYTTIPEKFLSTKEDKWNNWSKNDLNVK